MVSFGTDGIRGIAHRELTPELFSKVGRAAARVLHSGESSPLMLIGRDTRTSGRDLEAALASALVQEGWQVLLLGVVPTPAAAYLTRVHGAAAAAVISASHNPPQYNGLKFFGPQGAKIPPETEKALEALIAQGDEPPVPAGGAGGRLYDDPEALTPYWQFLLDRLGDGAVGRHLVLDCGHGALWELAPRLFRAAGARVTALHHTPDGAAINVNCGSTNPQVAADAVRAHGAQAGFTFDGDGDRCLAVDHQGRLLDGDYILAVAGLGRLERNTLPGRALVATVMSNMGLDQAMAAAGGRVIRCPVGDRHVAETMMAQGLTLGGEQSGHIIFAETGQMTGDGLLTAVEMVREMAITGASLAELAARMKPWPQVHHNISVADNQRVAATPAVQAAVEDATARLAGNGRIVVRPSGTEPVIRVMVEAVDETQARELAASVRAVIVEAARQ